MKKKLIILLTSLMLVGCANERTVDRAATTYFVKVSDEAYFEMHIDLDDANAFMLKQGDIVDIID